MGYFNFKSNENEKEMSYDLRQIYARIVGEHMVTIAENRIAENLYQWFNSLEDLFTEVSFKFKDQEEDVEQYTTIKNEIITLANKHSSTWLGTSKKENELSELKASLRKLERFLYLKMEEANMFGTKYSEDEGL